MNVKALGRSNGLIGAIRHPGAHFHTNIVDRFRVKHLSDVTLFQPHRIGGFHGTASRCRIRRSKLGASLRLQSMALLRGTSTNGAVVSEGDWGDDSSVNVVWRRMARAA